MSYDAWKLSPPPWYSDEDPPEPEPEPIEEDARGEAEAMARDAE